MEAERRDELVIVCSAHHGTDSLDANAPDELAAACGPTDEHGHGSNPGCDRDPRTSTPLHFGPDLVRLFHRFPNVIGFVAGHSHENTVQPFEDADGSGDFWEIKSPAIADWPPQHRLIEVTDNRDGTLSIFGTMLDHDGPSGAPRGGNAARFSLAELASVGRTIAYNDPQVGPDGSQGERADRNVELLLQDPRRGEPPAVPGPPPTQDGGPGGPVGDDGEDADTGGRSGGVVGSGGGGAETAEVAGATGVGGDDDGSLPFTGMGIAALVLLGVVLAGGGVALRRGGGRIDSP